MTSPTVANIVSRGGLPRAAAFVGLRIAGTLAGAVALLVGIGYLVVSAVGPDVWWFGGGTGEGAMVPFPLPLRLLNASVVLAWSATVAALAFIVSTLARTVRTEVRFARSISRSAWALAIALAIGSTVARVLENIARGSALDLTNEIDPGNPVNAPIHWGLDASAFVPDWPLLGLSVVIGLLAGREAADRDRWSGVMGSATTTSTVSCRLDQLLVERGLTLTILSEMVGISIVNLSVLKNDRARAVRFSTLAAICDALDCDIGDVLSVRPAV